MRGARRTVWMLVVVAGAACPLQGYVGWVAGTPLPDRTFGECVGGEFQGPDFGNLVVSQEADPTDMLSILNGGSWLKGCNGWASGFYDCPGANFHLEPTKDAVSVWVLAGGYPEGEPAPSHRGWIFLDSTPGTTADLHQNVTQALVPVSAEARRIPIAGPPGTGGWTPDPGAPRSTLTAGITYRFRAVVEFGRDREGDLTCRIGGDTAGTGFDDRPLAGYNIYRLRNVAPGLSTPDHYLLGPDLLSGTGDEGWVAFYPSGTGAGGEGLDLSDPAGPPERNDNDPGDCFDIEGRDADGDTVIGPYDDAILVYKDFPGLAPNAPSPEELQAGSFTYAFQPVLKGGIVCPHCIAGPYAACRTADVTGDGVADAVDLDGDGAPEFVDPSGHGYGLTADLGGRRTILVSEEVEARRAGPSVVKLPRLYEGARLP